MERPMVVRAPSALKYSPVVHNTASCATSGDRPIVSVSGFDPATSVNAEVVAWSARNVGYDVVDAAYDEPSSETKRSCANATRSAPWIPGGGASMSRDTSPHIAALVPTASA